MSFAVLMCTVSHVGRLDCLNCFPICFGALYILSVYLTIRGTLEGNFKHMQDVWVKRDVIRCKNILWMKLLAMYDLDCQIMWRNGKYVYFRLIQVEGGVRWIFKQMSILLCFIFLYSSLSYSLLRKEHCVKNCTFEWVNYVSYII